MISFLPVTKLDTFLTAIIEQALGDSVTALQRIYTPTNLYSFIKAQRLSFPPDDRLKVGIGNSRP
jgi:hypothetical protein